MSQFLTAETAARLSDAVYAIESNQNTNVEQAFRQLSGTAGLMDEFEVSGSSARFSGQSGAIFKSTSGFGTLLKKRSGGEYALVIRGTSSMDDWLSNANIALDRGPTGVPVHAGFNRIFKSMRDQVSTALQGLNPTTVHVVGHSLGGALANLFAADLSVNRSLDVKLYTFGAPRPGTSFFSNQLAQQLQGIKARRVYDLADPVPMIPLWPFFHCPTGSRPLDSGSGSISFGAHSMSNNYIPQMVQGGWPAIATRPANRTVDNWLSMANASSNPFSSAAYWSLAKALDGLLDLAKGVAGNAFLVGMVGVTLLDKLSDMLIHAAQIAAKVGSLLVRFIKAVMRFIGYGVGMVVNSVKDITSAFLRSILNRMFSVIMNMATRAVQRPR